MNFIKNNGHWAAFWFLNQICLSKWHLIMSHSSYNKTVIINSSKLHKDSIASWRTTFLYSDRLLARSRTSLKMFSCEVTEDVCRALPEGCRQASQQERSTSTECPCRQLVQRVSGAADQWCLTDELVHSPTASLKMKSISHAIKCSEFGKNTTGL